MTNVLFIRDNFPGQFRHITQTLARIREVSAIGAPTAAAVSQVKFVKYSFANQGSFWLASPSARRFDLECRRAEEIVYAASNLVSAL